MVKHAYREEANRNVGIQRIDFSKDVRMAGRVASLIYVYSFIFCALSHRNISEQLVF